MNLCDSVSSVLTMTPQKKEVPKRLEPKKDVLTRLFSRSGNLCAFPGCSRSIMNANGVRVGQICHIEGAEPDGERFNENQTNEQRRAYSNLILLCYEHHVETNDIKKFDTPRMQQMKAEHERKIDRFVQSLRWNVTDLTAADVMRPAKILAKFDPSLAVNLNPAEIQQTVDVVNGILARIHRLPRPARELLAIIAERAKPSSHPLGRSYISVHELQMHCGLEPQKLSEVLQVLDEHAFIVDCGPDDYGHPRVALKHWDGWDIWSDFRKYQTTSGVTLYELIVNLNFALLD